MGSSNTTGQDENNKIINDKFSTTFTGKDDHDEITRVGLKYSDIF